MIRQDYKPDDKVIWTNPANNKEFEATILKSVPSQGLSVSLREYSFEIRLMENAKTLIVPISQLRKA